MVGLIIAAVITFCIGVALLLMLLGGRSVVAQRLAQVTAPSATVTGEPAEPTLVFENSLKWLTPIRRAIGLSDDADVKARMAILGYRNESVVDMFYAAKLLGPVVAGVICGFFIHGDVIVWFLVLAALGFFAPDFWLTSAITKRRERIRLSLPDALDLLVICMEAGLGMDQALIRVGEEMRITHSELSEEFLLINLEQRAGKPRVEAWRNMADRTALETVKSFVNMLVQTEKFGTPLSKSLGQFADSLRVQRRQKAEEMAAKTTIKLVFPLVLFIFPSMFIVLLGPAMISIMKGFSEAFGK